MMTQLSLIGKNLVPLDDGKFTYSDHIKDPLKYISKVERMASGLMAMCSLLRGKWERSKNREVFYTEFAKGCDSSILCGVDGFISQLFKKHINVDYWKRLETGAIKKRKKPTKKGKSLKKKKKPLKKKKKKKASRTKRR